MFFLSTGMQLFSQFSHFYVHLAMVIFIQSTDNDGLITSEKMPMIMAGSGAYYNYILRYVL